MPVDFVQIDAFTDRAFAGNPAAVFVLDGPADPDWMQNVAIEMNLSETAFLHPEGKGWRLRWFTPAHEVELCGHATLASAYALITEHAADPAKLRFQTRSGELFASADSSGRVTLDFPSDPPTVCEPPRGLHEALGTDSVSVAKGVSNHLVELADAATVRDLTPNFSALQEVEVRGAIVTARNDRDGFDMVSRCFAPRAGIPEDPVTGSAHTTLAPWWAPRLGKTQLRAEQASRRGGVLDVELVGDRVLLAGQAVTVARGQLLC